MREYYEELWRQLPEYLVLPDLDLRRRFLRGEIRPGDTVLDLGCGEGTFAAEIGQAAAAVVGVDVAEAALERARASHGDIDFLRVDIDAPLPFEERQFSLVWASEVIEHVSDTARWLSEVRRVLAPGGRVLITSPSHGRLRVALGGMERFSPPLGDHLHLYTRRSLATTLSEFRFEEVRVRATGGAPFLRRILLACAQR